MGIKTNIILTGGNPPIPMNIIQGSVNHYPRNILLDGNRIYEIVQGLREEMDDISSQSEVTVTVNSYQELTSYDKTTLINGDVIKVTSDESNQGRTVYYRWDETTQTFQTLGVGGMYYTKSETDSLLEEVQQDITNLTTQVSNIEQTVETNKSYVEQDTEILTIPI